MDQLPTKGKNNQVRVRVTNKRGQREEVSVQVDFDEQYELYQPVTQIVATPLRQRLDAIASVVSLSKTKSEAADLAKDAPGVEIVWEQEPDRNSAGRKNAKLKVIYPDQTEDIVDVQVDVKATTVTYREVFNNQNNLPLPPDLFQTSTETLPQDQRTLTPPQKTSQKIVA
ncbi:MAG: Rib/alpha-like domain-containing protein [bacterium]|nr:Rib/alpha-like domain-containing protein [bacterium]